MLTERTVTLKGGGFVVFTEQGADGGWSAHTREPEEVGGLGDTLEAAIADWKFAMKAWLSYERERSDQSPVL